MILKGARCFYEFDSSVSKVGNFTSPNFPKKYNASAFCYYNFIGHDFETLKLDFEAFDLEQPYSKGCLTDYVDISTITASNVKELVGRYCGNKIDSPVLSMHPKAEIIFRSNHVIEGHGFFGTYEFKDEMLIPPPNSTANILGCGGIVTGVGGTIVSPGYPQYFPKDIECVWLIRVDHNKHIYTRILELQLYGSIANCNDVELSIYDGYSSFSFNPEIIKKYCGDLKYYKNVEERTQMSKRNRLLVRFKSKVGADQKGDPSKIIGFRMVWTAVAFEFNGKCDQYVCHDSHYCLNSASTVCSDMPEYCIDKTLVCNGVPNCSEEDFSDEDKCYLPVVFGALIGGFGVIGLLVLVVYACKSRKKRVERNSLALQLRQLEHSPSSIARGGPRGFPRAREYYMHRVPDFADEAYEMYFKELRTRV
ncbi:CUB domain-containing protein 2 [Trichonephila inaurata madagascariensis]|uniref:CUB domain-containing protein 2 n=1 Tax=Trichonephila inaurata madagascariensis TaxID=2747483 RepID=A0A8X6XDZ2_9ARAC|nr:CUB domain-containing protein 2 [Trichonephila inaurata madagascariensis]